MKTWQSLLGGKYFILFLEKPIKLTSAVGVRLMGQYKHTNINLTTDGVRLVNLTCLKKEICIMPLYLAMNRTSMLM